MGMRGADEASLGPTMVAALDSTGEMSFASVTDSGAAMPAHIEKGLQRVCCVASDDDTFFRDFTEKIVTRRRDSVSSSGTDPVLAVEAFEFVAKEIRVSVVTG